MKKLLRALTALRAQPAFAKATAGESGKEGFEPFISDLGKINDFLKIIKGKTNDR